MPTSHIDNMTLENVTNCIKIRKEKSRRSRKRANWLRTSSKRVQDLRLSIGRRTSVVRDKSPDDTTSVMREKRSKSPIERTSVMRDHQSKSPIELANFKERIRDRESRNSKRSSRSSRRSRRRSVARKRSRSRSQSPSRRSVTRFSKRTTKITREDTYSEEERRNHSYHDKKIYRDNMNYPYEGWMGSSRLFLRAVNESNEDSTNSDKYDPYAKLYRKPEKQKNRKKVTFKNNFVGLSETIDLTIETPPRQHKKYKSGTEWHPDNHIIGFNDDPFPDMIETLTRRFESYFDNLLQNNERVILYDFTQFIRKDKK